MPTSRGLDAAEMVEAARRGDIEVLWSSGGNFLDVLPAPDITRTALARTPLRVHQDIVLTHQMLVDPGETVVLLPAATRYEQEGGGTSTTTERRVAFSPELDGPRVGEARSEWRDLPRRRAPGPTRTAPTAFGCETAQAIREEIARVVPAYAGIESLRETGDAIQVGGARLCEGGVFPTPDGRARFSVVVPDAVDVPPGPVPALDPARQAVQLHGVEGRRPAHRCRPRRAAPVARPTRPRSASVRRRGARALAARRDAGPRALAPIRPRQRAGVLPGGERAARADRRDPISGVPDYNAVVEVVPVA